MAEVQSRIAAKKAARTFVFTCGMRIAFPA
jgi:hypothetical protein